MELNLCKHENKEMFEQIKDILCQIEDKSETLLYQRDNAKSTCLKELLNKILNITIKIIKIGNENINYYGQILKNNIEQEQIMLEKANNQIKNTNSLINTHLHNEEMVRSLYEHNSSFIHIIKNQYTDLCGIHNFNELLLLHVLYLSFCSTLIVLQINDYNKTKEIKEKISNLINVITGTNPITAIPITLYNVVVGLSKLANALDESLLQDDFFNDVDNKIIILEKQIQLLNELLVAQNEICGDFKEILKNA